LLEDAIKSLAVRPDGVYADCTFGRGGHSRALLARLGETGRLFICDKDSRAIACAESLFNGDHRVVIIHGSFLMLDRVLEQHQITACDGILLDLGVSSPQLEDPDYGFSFQRDGDLDMRMDRDSGESAAEWLNRAAEDEIADVIYRYGEERYSRRIAAAIVRIRKEQPITRTLQLAKAVHDAVPTRERNKDPATRTFQAIRIHINNELDEIRQFLARVCDLLRPGGRLVVISFHSLEDRIVKRFFATEARGDRFPLEVPVRSSELKPTFRLIGKPIKPTAQEIDDNPRARSAVLRVGERIAA
jgi:16S rRNA (cytosine1402-N4)-methyltransferase